MKKLILYGDSLFANASKSIIQLLEDKLVEYDIYNCAVGGWNTEDCVRKAPYISKLDPDVLVVSLGTNDAAPYKQIPLEEYTRNIPKIVNNFPNSKIVWFLPPPVDEEITKKLGKHIPNSVMKEFHDAAKKICEEQNIAYIDSFRVFGALHDEGREYHIDDGVHFNDLGYEIIAYQLAKILS